MTLSPSHVAALRGRDRLIVALARLGLRPRQIAKLEGELPASAVTRILNVARRVLDVPRFTSGGKLTTESAPTPAVAVLLARARASSQAIGAPLTTNGIYAPLPPDVVAGLTPAAAARGQNVRDLVRDLLTELADVPALIDAVLDDGIGDVDLRKRSAA